MCVNHETNHHPTTAAALSPILLPRFLTNGSAILSPFFSHTGIKELSKEAGEKWRAMDDSAKSPFEAKAAAAKVS